MDKIKNYAKTAVIYFIGNVFSKLVALFLLPLYTNRLEPYVMGEYDYAVTLLNFAAPICFFQIWDAMFRFSFDYENENQKRKVVSNSFIVCVWGIVVFSLLLVVLQSVVRFQYIGLIYAYGLTIAINYLYSYLARVYRNNLLFSVSGFVNSLIVAICNIVLILRYNLGLQALYISVICGAIAQCIMIEIFLRPISKISLKDYDKKLITEMIKFSVPLCIATISYWLLSGYTKVLIVHFLGTEENGLYAITNKFASLINMIVSIFQFAWNEMAYIYNKDEGRNLMYTTATAYIIHYVIMASCCLMIVSKIMFPVVIGTAYQAAIVYLPTAIIGVGLNAIAGFIGTVFSTEKKTKYIFSSTFAAAVLNVVFGGILTKHFALHGAMIALAGSFMILLIIRIYWMNNYIGTNVKICQAKHALLIASTIIFFYVCNKTILDIVYLGILLLIEIIINWKLYKRLFVIVKAGCKK